MELEGMSDIEGKTAREAASEFQSIGKSLLAIYRKSLTMHARARYNGGHCGDREVSARRDRIRRPNSRYHTNSSSDRVFFRRRCNDLTFERITTAKLNVWTRP